MSNIFSRLGLAALLLLLAACGPREADVISPPKDVAAIVAPFLDALRKGQKAEARKYVLDGAADELDAQFGPDHVRLAQGPALKPRLMEERVTAQGTDIVIAYAARQNGQWTSATVRVSRPDSKSPYKIAYWRITGNPPSLATGAAALEETAAMARQSRLIFWGILALFAMLCLGLLIWAWRNRTRPDAHDNQGADGRSIASTTRD